MLRKFMVAKAFGTLKLSFICLNKGKKGKDGRQKLPHEDMNLNRDSNSNSHCDSEYIEGFS